MNTLENINLEDFLELENRNKVLSFMEFQDTINYIKSQIMAYLYLFTKEKYIDAKSILWNDYDKYRKSLPIYKAIYILYNQLLNDLVLEMKDSSIEKDPLSISILLGNYLIPFGFLSYTSNFHRIITKNGKLFSKDFSFEYYSYLNGLYILAGYGCCRHVVSFVSDCLHKMKIPNDKVTCAIITKKEILSNMLEHALPNHLILGCETNHKYYLMDIYNQIYNLTPKEEYVENGLSEKIVLDYTHTHLFQPELYWNPNLEYGTITEEEINEKKYKVAMALRQGEAERFERFKQEHFDTYQKLAYLVPLELERTKEKENQKIKEYRY